MKTYNIVWAVSTEVYYLQIEFWVHIRQQVFILGICSYMVSLSISLKTNPAMLNCPTVQCSNICLNLTLTLIKTPYHSKHHHPYTLRCGCKFIIIRYWYESVIVWRVDENIGEKTTWHISLKKFEFYIILCTNSKIKISFISPESYNTVSCFLGNLQTL